MCLRSPLERPRLLVVLITLVVVVAVIVLVMAPGSIHAGPYARETLLARPLPTYWNLTCPTQPEATLARIEGSAVDEGPALSEVLPCVERELQQRSERHGNMWVLYNYVPALERPRCWEAVTLTTHGDFTYLASLGQLVSRWKAPVSVALYAPGDDLATTRRAILWARACMQPPLVARHVSFHILLDSAHMPRTVPPPPRLSDVDSSGPPTSCDKEAAPWLQVGADETYRRRHGLFYPVNVARNVARETAGTHFVFPSDVELLPSAGLSQAFLTMVRRQPQLVRQAGRRVFVVPVFEVGLGVQPPDDKAQLVEQLRSGEAAPFHEHLCRECHDIPLPQQWVCAPPRSDGALGVTTVARREGRYGYWEAFYIGTHGEPLYDERLSWEGMRDKIVQSYTMCLLGYEFHVLDDAFLVHWPGVKAPSSHEWRAAYAEQTKALIKSTILPELTKLYGRSSKCTL